MLAMRFTLILQEGKTNTHHNVWWMLVLGVEVKWKKLSTRMILITTIGQAMHRKLRASLTSVSDLSLRVSRRKT
jgi:hypothetical protein